MSPFFPKSKSKDIKRGIIVKIGSTLNKVWLVTQDYILINYYSSKIWSGSTFHPGRRKKNQRSPIGKSYPTLMDYGHTKES